LLGLQLGCKLSYLFLVDVQSGPPMICFSLRAPCSLCPPLLVLDAFMDGTSDRAVQHHKSQHYIYRNGIHLHYGLVSNLANFWMAADTVDAEITRSWQCERPVLRINKFSEVTESPWSHILLGSHLAMGLDHSVRGITVPSRVILG